MVKDYKPRRAGKRWLEGAPEYVLDCFDNRGKTCDRYTVMFGGSMYVLRYGRIAHLDMSGAPTHPQGVSLWGDSTLADAAAFRYREGHYRVRWLDLPENVRAHVVARATED